MAKGDYVARWKAEPRHDGEPSLLRLAKQATNYFDGDIAAIVGMKRSTVQAVISGRIGEYLDDQQKAALLSAVRDHLAEAQERLDEMELFG